MSTAIGLQDADPRERVRLRRRLLVWYRRQRRPLPWRGTRDPYRIWVSETMLQQTRVATVIPYYHSFLERFPTLTDLARAPESRVLAAWSGLGYYRRARDLRRAAQCVVREHGGRVPDAPDAFGRLPGVGRYTTGAVLSLAFDRPLPVLDGNVARVIARLLARPWSVRRARDARALWRVAESWVPARGPGEWNQALMELGATVCTPRAPRCAQCPVRALCRAYALDRVEGFPPATPRRESGRVRRALALVSAGGRFMVTRCEGRLLQGMWEPPGVDVGGGASARPTLIALLAGLGVRARLTPLGLTVRHTITDRVIAAELWHATVETPAPRASGTRWVRPDAGGVALTALARKALRAVSE